MSSQNSKNEKKKGKYNQQKMNAKEKNRERVRQCRERAKKAKNDVKIEAVPKKDDVVPELKNNIFEHVKEELISQNQFRKRYPDQSRSQIREMYKEYSRTGIFPDDIGEVLEIEEAISVVENKEDKTENEVDEMMPRKSEYRIKLDNQLRELGFNPTDFTTLDTKSLKKQLQIMSLEAEVKNTDARQNNEGRCKRRGQHKE